MSVDEDYKAIKKAYERLQEDYELLEQREGNQDYEKKYLILSQRITEREEYIEELEVRLTEYIQQSEQYDVILDEKKQNIEKLQHRIEELEQWTGHLQSLCDERLERVNQLELYIHHPVFNIIKLVRIWIAEKRKKNDRR